MNAQYRWFRPTIPCMLLGFILGFLPDTNGSLIRDVQEGATLAALGLTLDPMVHERP